MRTILGGLTVEDGFAQMLSRIELNATRVALASQRYQAVKKTLEAALPGKAVKQIGSFQRQTKIRPQDLSDALDLDVLVVFHAFTAFAAPGQKGTTPAESLQIVRKALVSNDIYHVMAPKQDSPVVVLEYADDFKIELVPAFIDKTGLRNHPSSTTDCYIVPGADGNWPAADYDYDAEFITAANKRSDGQLVPMIKLLKNYFRAVNMKMKPFKIEIMAAQTIPGLVAEWTAKNFTWGYQHLTAAFLSEASSLISQDAQIPGSYSPAIKANLGLNEVLTWPSFLKGRSEEAWRLCGLKDDPAALAGWRKFFGDSFPAA